MTKEDLIDFVKNNDFAFCFNAGRDVCNAGMNEYELCVSQIVDEIEKASYISEADEDMKAEFEEDVECIIYQAGAVAIAYYEV